MSGIVGKNLGRGSGIITATPVGADAVDSANIADDAIDSEHYANGSIDNAHIADDAIDSEHYAAGSIDTAHIATNQIDETLMKDAFVGDFTDATVTASDYFLHGDATDSGNTKKDTVQGILDLTSSVTDIKFHVRQSADANNVTGNATSYSITHANWTEVYDTGADIANGTFQAPATGKYLLVAFINWAGITSAHSVGFGHIVTSNRSYNGFEGDYYQSSATVNRVSWSVLADMDVDDTAYLTVEFRGESGDVVDITQCQFSGALLA